MKHGLYICLVFSIFSFGQLRAQKIIYTNNISAVLENYAKYREAAINTRLFKHNDIVKLIEKHAQNRLLTNEIIGTSVEGRSIHHLTVGKGKTKVLLWSQMHGDEATATMALFDLFNFLKADDEFNPLKYFLLSELELHFVPMLNPDGAQIWTRTNAMKIDINRDAKNLATPEARALMDLAKRLKPDFGFNLHDQSTYYAAGKNTANTATLSFLAPAYNMAKDMNSIRTKAVQVIAAMNEAVQQIIPNRVAKYNDTYDSRCFGDTFQGMGISTILIESGGFPLDPDKQYIRKVNFLALLTALNSIASQTYTSADENKYWNLPNNYNNLHDLIVRNINIPDKGKKIDIAINRWQKVSPDFSSFDFNGIVVKTANMDSAFAYQEFDASGLDFTQGKTMMMKKAKWEDLTPRREKRLIKKGILFVDWEDEPSPLAPVKNRLLNLTNGEQFVSLNPSSPANFILARKGRPKYAVINGYLIDLSKKAVPFANTFGY